MQRGLSAICVPTGVTAGGDAVVWADQSVPDRLSLPGARFSWGEGVFGIYVEQVTFVSSERQCFLYFPIQEEGERTVLWLPLTWNSPDDLLSPLPSRCSRSS